MGTKYTTSANMAPKYDPQAMVKVNLDRPMGITFEEFEAYDGLKQKGVFITEILPNSNAAKAGNK